MYLSTLEVKLRGAWWLTQVELELKTRNHVEKLISAVGNASLPPHLLAGLKQHQHNTRPGKVKPQI
jgi:hypothetical protein